MLSQTIMTLETSTEKTPITCSYRILFEIGCQTVTHWFLFLHPADADLTILYFELCHDCNRSCYYIMFQSYDVHKILYKEGSKS